MEWQHVRAVGGGPIGLGVDLQEEGIHPYGHGGPGEGRHEFPLA